MEPSELKNRNFENEFVYTATRSSGPGGQNVNKVSSRVELRFNVMNSALLSEDEKAVIIRKLVNRINKEGELTIVSQSERSQLRNRESVTERFYEIIAKALTKQKRRKATSPTFSSKLKRLEKKHIRGQIKRYRKDAGTDQEQ